MDPLTTALLVSGLGQGLIRSEEGLAAWDRVRDYRLQALQQMANVDMYPASEMNAGDLLEMAHAHIIVATGARWTRFLYSALEIPVGRLDGPGVYTPDDLAAGQWPEGPVLVFDFDNYYMGGLLAEHLAAGGTQVSYATPAGHVSAWTVMTNEQPYVHQALHRHGVVVHTLSLLAGFDGVTATLEQVFTREPLSIDARSVVIVGHRQSRNRLYQELMARKEEFADAGIRSVQRAGDALAAGAIVHAVHSGHRCARQLDEPTAESMLRDLPVGVQTPGPAYPG